MTDLNKANDFLSAFLEDDEDAIAIAQDKQRSIDNSIDEGIIDYKEGTRLKTAHGAAEQRTSTSIKNYDENHYKIIERLIERNMKALRDKYPSGGIRSSRYITSEVLLKAPENFFDRFDDEIRDGAIWIQTALTDRGQSAAVGDAVAHPGEEIYQEAAYKTVQGLVLEYLGRKVWSGIDRAIVSTLIINEIIGLSRLEPLWNDSRITEIICNGPSDIQVEVAGRLLRVPSCKFRDVRHIYSLLEKIYQAGGKQLSRMTPRLKTSLGANNRVYAIDTSVAPTGPNLNIRRHSEKYWTPEDIINLGSANEEMMTMLGNLIYKGISFVVVGGMSTGKTSMLNALTGFYRNDARIVTLEDSLELRPNPRKMLAAPMACIAPRPDKENDKGVNMRDLVQSATQMAPKVIIVGEVTDGAAYDLCQALNTGHAGASTFHANTSREAIPRLRSLIGQGEIISADAALPLISAAFDIIIYLSHSLIDGSRRIQSIVEVPSYPSFDEQGEPYLEMKTLYQFEEAEIIDNKVVGSWKKHSDISNDLIERRGLDLERDLSWEELKELSRVD